MYQECVRCGTLQEGVAALALQAADYEPFVICCLCLEELCWAWYFDATATAAVEDALFARYGYEAVIVPAHGEERP
jgi:hypothetical protein